MFLRPICSTLDGLYDRLHRGAGGLDAPTREGAVHRAGAGWRVDAGLETVFAEDVVRGAVAKHLAWAVIQPVDRFLQPVRVDGAQVLGLGHNLAR